jgi:hypothetical protein
VNEDLAPHHNPHTGMDCPRLALHLAGVHRTTVYDYLNKEG